MALGIPICCLRCQAGLGETILHRFHHYARTQSAWHFALIVLYTYLGISHMNGTWPALAWQQWLLASTFPWCLQKGRHLWSLLWTTMPYAFIMRIGRCPMWRIYCGRSSWIMGAWPDFALVEYKSFIRLGQPRRFVSLTNIGCSILFLALKFVFRFTGTLWSVGL